MKKRGIVSFDLDMTLLDHKDWTISDSAMQAIESLRRNHFLIVIASGRDMDQESSSPYRDLIRPDAVIHLNGTKVTVGNQLLFEHFMNQELLERIAEFARDKQFALGLTVGTDDYYFNPEYVIRHDERRWKISNRNFQPPEQLTKMDIRTLVYLGNKAGVSAIEAAFPEVKLPMFSDGSGADVVERSASKAGGLKRLCKYYDIPISHTVAFGDSMNDYEIIRGAGIGVAMGNALDMLKEAADYVTDPIGQDGVYHACEALGLFDEDLQWPDNVTREMKESDGL